MNLHSLANPVSIANSVSRETPNSEVATCKIANFKSRQVEISSIDSKMDFCFRPIFSMKVILPNGKSTNVYGLLDTGSNKTHISKAFQQQFRIQT